MPVDDVFEVMHASMLEHFAQWHDEISLRHWGFRYSELISIERTIARLHAAAVAGSEQAAVERDELTREYIDRWLPHRKRMEGSDG